MSLLDAFTEFLVEDIEVFILADEVNTWGTTEKEYEATADRLITGYIQPRTGTDTFRNQSMEKPSTHRLYCYADVVLNDTDKLVYNGQSYQITFNAKDGIAGISDHKEIGLRIL